ncbi:hypothetical protein MKQ70_12590 [Chitinophaga sedimenti]|uniref:hypothetical protein n=1 Tax=Chitinophaga sedimenti TaxID=2033606 RepID=UPI002005726D|nr:hypothetical protein [Chitinophaga sedimenti]MCK7555810.1 hypothetical protein [Chitinophaga sedimenti]
MSDVVITGHEHQERVSVFSDLGKDYETVHIEAGVLQDSNLMHASNFNVINVNLNSLELSIQNYGYNHDGVYVRKSQMDKLIEKNKKLKTKLFQVKRDFWNDLENPGATFIHSSIDEILLSDIYIPPTLNDITIRNEKKSKNFTSM